MLRDAIFRKVFSIKSRDLKRGVFFQSKNLVKKHAACLQILKQNSKHPPLYLSEIQFLQFGTLSTQFGYSFKLCKLNFMYFNINN